ncbi:MAG: MFS transporter [Gammaproteobacteria bacterium]
MKIANYKIVLLSSMGAGLEFFDFTIYALFAHYISINFFPQTNTFIALINTFAIFAIGYLARPLGGIILGHIGDRYGRKYAFSYAILVMAVATLLIGCLPSYVMLGIYAPILLIVLRLIQGLSMGGEVAGAITFTLEHYEGFRKGLMQACIIFSMAFCSAIASLVGYFLNHLFSSAQMISWGWRIPFAFGFLLGIVGFILRRRSLETPAFLEALREEEIHKIPLLILIKQFPTQVIFGLCLAALFGCYSSFLLFIPTYLSLHALFPADYGFATSGVGFLTLGIVSLIGGYLADRINLKILMVTGGFLFILFGFFVFPILVGISVYNTTTLSLILIAIALLTTVVALANGVYAIAIAEQFPTTVKYSGIGLCQNLSFALIGGTAPLVFTSLIKSSNNLLAPYYYLVLWALITIIAAIFYRRHTVPAVEV